MALIIEKVRFYGAILYFALGVILIFFLIITEFDLLFISEKYPIFLPRILWCFSWSCMGFAWIAYKASKREPSEGAVPSKVSYLTIYPIFMILVSFLSFAIFQTFEQTNNYLFYFWSAPFCSFLSYCTDSILKDPIGFIKIIK